VTPPAIVFGLLVATFTAAAFHLVFGRTTRQLLLFWLASLAGFGVAQIVAGMFAWRIPAIGTLHIVEGFVFSIALMAVVKGLRL
jgi:hypothetical protein